MRAFVAVVETGRFAAAAERLRLSQPAVSHTIRGLEQRWGVRLLERTRAGVRTTAAGELLLTEAKAVLSRYDQAMDVLSSGKRTSTLLRLGIPFGLPAGMPATALAALTQDWRSTVIAIHQMSSVDQIELLERRELDIGLLRHRPVTSDLDATLVADEPLGALVSAARAEQLCLPATDVDLEALGTLRWQGFARDSSPPWYDEVTATLRGFGVDVEPTPARPQETSAEFSYATVSLGNTFTLAPACCRQTLPSALTWRRIAGDPLRRRTWAVWPATSRRRDVGELVALLEGAHDVEHDTACVG